MGDEFKTSRSLTELLIPSLFGLSLIGGILYMTDVKSKELEINPETIYVREPSPIIVSATHLEEIEGYEKVYDVPDTDRSYYINKSYKYSVVDVHTEVMVSTTQGLIRGRVIESVEGKFKVKVDDPTLVFNGMSGSSVLRKGEEIGFVSELTPDLEILCYTIN